MSSPNRKTPPIPVPRNAFEVPLFTALKHRFWPPHYGWLTTAYKDMDEFLTAGTAFAVGSGTDFDVVNPSPLIGGRGRPRALRRELAACLVYGGDVQIVALARFVTWVKLAWDAASTCERLLVPQRTGRAGSRWTKREEGFRGDVRSLLRGVKASKLKPQRWWLADVAPAIAARAVLALAKRVGTTRADAMASAAFDRYAEAPRTTLPASDEWEHTLQPRLLGNRSVDGVLAEIACFNTSGLAGVDYRVENLRHFSTGARSVRSLPRLAHVDLASAWPGWPTT